VSPSSVRIQLVEAGKDVQSRLDRQRRIVHPPRERRGVHDVAKEHRELPPRALRLGHVDDLTTWGLPKEPNAQGDGKAKRFDRATPEPQPAA
jgi:hypothetical protein